MLVDVERRHRPEQKSVRLGHDRRQILPRPTLAAVNLGVLLRQSIVVLRLRAVYDMAADRAPTGHRVSGRAQATIPTTVRCRQGRSFELHIERLHYARVGDRPGPDRPPHINLSPRFPFSATDFRVRQQRLATPTVVAIPLGRGENALRRHPSEILRHGSTRRSIESS